MTDYKNDNKIYFEASAGEWQPFEGFGEGFGKIETNFEHYKDDILRGSCLTFALDTRDGDVKPCREIDSCENCYFEDNSEGGYCGKHILEWLYEDYEPIIPSKKCYITEKDFHILKAFKFNKGETYIQKNAHGDVILLAPRFTFDVHGDYFKGVPRRSTYTVAEMLEWEVV